MHTFAHTAAVREKKRMTYQLSSCRRTVRAMTEMRAAMKRGQKTMTPSMLQGLMQNQNQTKQLLLVCTWNQTRTKPLLVLMQIQIPQHRPGRMDMIPVRNRNGQCPSPVPWTTATGVTPLSLIPIPHTLIPAGRLRKWKLRLGEPLMINT